MSTIKAPSPPYIPAIHYGLSGVTDNYPIHRIVIHATVSPCEDGGARAVARYFQSPSSGGSAHYVVDPSETIQCVYDKVIAWHAPPNQNSLGIELCDPQNGDHWHDTNHQSMLNAAAHLTAKLALVYNVPIVKLTAHDLLAGKHGICGHVDVSYAWHQSDHTDPGQYFPWNEYMKLVHDKANAITARHTAKSHNGANRKGK